MEGILAILKEKVAEGVDVRVLYDDLGTCKYLKGNYHLKMLTYFLLSVYFKISVFVTHRLTVFVWSLTRLSFKKL